MPPLVLDIRNASAADRRDALTRASDALRAGRLAVLPTETVYGVAAAARNEGAIAALREITDLNAGDPFAWHAPDADRVLDATRLTAPVHLRALERLAPGPVTLLIELDEPAMDAARHRLGVAPGVMDNGRELLVRVPSQRDAMEALRLTGEPVVMAGAAPRGTPAPTAAELAFNDDALARIELVLNAGPTMLRMPSSAVRLKLDGSYEVVREGAVDAARIEARLARTLLFVCSGNTCRSPMAEAIAQAMLADRDLGGVPVIVQSAGSGASEGAPATPEAARALRSLGFELDRHRSRPLTRDLIERVDAVFGMTPSHVEAALAIAPDQASKVRTLDPAGGSIPDPIGQSQQVYDEAARRIRDLVAQRLDELFPQPASAGSSGSGGGS